MHKGPGSNHENYEGGFDEACAIIWEGLNELMKKAGKNIDEISFTLMGLAGIDHPFQHDELYTRLEKYGLKKFELFNDGYIVVKAGASGREAIGYNCGTGTCCNAIDSDGNMMQLSGLGEFSGDIGNGHWIASTVYRTIYDDIYLNLGRTSMTDMFFNEYSLTCKEDFLDKVSDFENENAEPLIMRLIDFFFDALAAGDEKALKIADEMAERGSDLISAHVKNLNFTCDTIEVILSGSIHVKLPSEKYLELLEN